MLQLQDILQCVQKKTGNYWSDMWHDWILGILFQSLLKNKTFCIHFYTFWNILVILEINWCFCSVLLTSPSLRAESTRMGSVAHSTTTITGANYVRADNCKEWRDCHWQLPHRRLSKAKLLWKTRTIQRDAAARNVWLPCICAEAKVWPQSHE
jgi:hypothetical protein